MARQRQATQVNVRHRINKRRLNVEKCLKTLEYLRKNKDRVDYPHERKADYPTGSGGIEFSNKYISNIRLKRSGA